MLVTDIALLLIMPVAYVVCAVTGDKDHVDILVLKRFPHVAMHRDAPINFSDSRVPSWVCGMDRAYIRTQPCPELLICLCLSLCSTCAIPL